jgi:hypothetical protein
MSVGMPAGIWLVKFGVIVADYFGHIPYHVGSSLKTKQWRDVDVRLILPDEEFNASAPTRAPERTRSCRRSRSRSRRSGSR